MEKKKNNSVIKCKKFDIKFFVTKDKWKNIKSSWKMKRLSKKAQKQIKNKVYTRVKKIKSG